jgi:hypothetical protein
VRHSSSRHTVRVVGRVVVTPTPTYHMSVARRRLLRLLCSTEENGNPFNVDVATMRIHACASVLMNRARSWLGTGIYTLSAFQKTGS